MVEQMAFFAEDTSREDAPRLGRVKARCVIGDVWQLGRHWLYIGDCAAVTHTKAEYKTLTVITDPPYGINHDGNYHRFTNGLTDRRNWHKPIAGDDRPFDPRPLLKFARVVLWGANCYPGKLPAGSMLVWDKRHANGKAFLADGEVAWMKGGHGVYIYSLTSQGFVRPEPILHPTQKPVRLFEWCMAKAKAGELVYDPYLGSGTSLIACERTGRTCYGCEIEPAYGDVILTRWERYTHKKAERVVSGATMEKASILSWPGGLAPMKEPS